MAKATRKTTRRASTRQRAAAKRLQKWRNSPAGRLDADGASKREQIERRALWLSREWQLPRCPNVGRTMSKQLSDYTETHGVSLDWLLCGDLPALQRMMQKRRGRALAATPESLRDKLARLSESEREIIRKLVDQFGATS